MTIARALRWLLTSLCATLLPALAQAEVAQVAVAANFAEPIKVLAAELERTTGHTLRITLGSTGKLYAQIKNGAPFDAMLAANTQVPSALEKEGLAQPSSRFTYAIGKLVLWSAQANRIDANGQVLSSPGLGKVAYANPQTAPYGAAAVQLMASLGLSERLRPLLVQGESIGQTFSFVHTGNADVGFVALSQVMVNGQLKSGSMWLPPQDLYEPIKQDAVLLQRGASNAAALAFMQLLKTPQMQAMIRAHGYAL